MIDFYKNEIEPGECKPYFSGYIGLTSVKSFSAQIEKQIDLTGKLFEKIDKKALEFRYAPGKWSLAEVIGHITDTERVFCYRALRIARNDKTPLSGFEQDVFAASAPFSKYKKEDLLIEYSAVRLSTTTLFEYISREELARKTMVDGHPLSVRAIAFIILGHEIHHMNIINKHYIK